MEVNSSHARTQSDQIPKIISFRQYEETRRRIQVAGDGRNEEEKKCWLAINIGPIMRRVVGRRSAYSMNDAGHIINAGYDSADCYRPSRHLDVKTEIEKHQ